MLHSLSMEAGALWTRQAGCITVANSSKEILWFSPVCLCQKKYVDLAADRFLIMKIAAVFTEIEQTHLGSMLLLGPR